MVSSVHDWMYGNPGTTTAAYVGHRGAAGNDISRMYKTTLGRDASADEVAYWQGTGFGGKDLASTIQSAGAAERATSGFQLPTAAETYGANDTGNNRFDSIAGGLYNNPSYEEVLSPLQSGQLYHTSTNGFENYGNENGAYDWVQPYMDTDNQNKEQQFQLDKQNKQLGAYEGIDDNFVSGWGNFDGSFTDYVNSVAAPGTSTAGTGGVAGSGVANPSATNDNDALKDAFKLSVNGGPTGNMMF